MTKANYLSQPTIQRIPVLLQEIRDRVVVIPRFQRPFVWTDQQRLELMESIYSGIPIGSLLVWRTHDQGLQTYELHGTKSDRKDQDSGQRNRDRRWCCERTAGAPARPPSPRFGAPTSRARGCSGSAPRSGSRA